MAALSYSKLLVTSFTVLIAVFTKQRLEKDKTNFFSEHPNSYLLPEAAEYDFIIVGAGSAGSIVANKLSRDFRVLLLESGGDPVPQTYVPANADRIIEYPPAVHKWISVEQAHSTLATNGITDFVQGKFLGGSSVVNAIMYNRGNAKDYDQWAELTGDSSWNYTNLIKYFKMTENFYEEENFNGHLGTRGPLYIRRGGTEYKSLYNSFLEAGDELGYKRYTNPNSPQTPGFGPISSNIHFGRRMSTYDAFLSSVLSRKTLCVSRYSTVTKVDVSEDGRAVGVHYTRHGVEMYARARHEIILSAGALNSPLILIRSGIGPSEQLQAAGIPVKVDLQVGKHFQDHPRSFVIGHFTNNTKFQNNDLYETDIDNFLLKGSGPLTVPFGILAQAFVVSSVAKEEGNPDWPHIQLLLTYNSAVHFSAIPLGYNGVSVQIALIRPSSEGSISLNVTNPNGEPIFDPRWLDDERDLKIFAEGAKIAATILETKAFKDLGVSLDRTVTPGCDGLLYGSNEYWECHVQQVTYTFWHPVGTCRMGRRDDLTAVVDTEFRVKGIIGLRVVDNSIQPKIINANTNAPAMMIGQKASSMILRAYGRNVG